MNDSVMQCCRCKWWETAAKQQDVEQELGKCNRYPPFFIESIYLPANAELVKTQDDRYGFFFQASTKPIDWCTEFEKATGASSDQR